MKKTVITILLIIAFLIIYFLQANFFDFVTIAGVKPNLFVIFVLFVGLFTTSAFGICFGVILGLFLDLIYGKCIGISAVMFCIIGFLGGYFDRNFSKESRFTIMLMSIGSTLIFEIGSYFLNIIILKYDVEMAIFVKKILIETLYNTMLVIILYPIMQKLGYGIELNFKRNNVLTRYF